MKKLLAITLAAAGPFALAACNDRPYAKQDHVVIDEIEASSVNAEPGVELWVVMVPEGDFRERCGTNLGGTYRPDGNRYCIIPAP